MAYAYLCTRCDHLLSNHTLADDGDTKDGPYRCAHCPCERPQEGDEEGLTRPEFEQYMARPDTPPNIWADK